MTIKENKLMVIPYQASFGDKYIIDDNINLLLNKISIHKCSGNEVDFVIRVIDGKRVIYPLDNCEKHYLLGNRLVKVITIDIKSGDYFTKEVNGNDYCFMINSEKINVQK